ncbi:MAG: 16S rRNA (guanine(966)-N(2))-methyltransferase RsmD [Bacilli bacterium]|nr:16S rRNA (guanine(966)-N(2))-methyltransferase RsmD [Bacilli bacterium]
MRIIAGINRGRKLETLEGLSTRPTLDGTKEAIFSSLGGMLPGFTILDVFGGSGALSLESISRGAKKAYILDNNLDAINIIKKNAQNLNSMKELTVLYGDYKQIIKRFDNSNMFDIIFLDPPFRLKVIDELIIYIIENDLLADGGYIVAEYPKEDVVQKDYEGYKVKLCRRYSSSEVLILEKE